MKQTIIDKIKKSQRYQAIIKIKKMAIENGWCEEKERCMYPHCVCELHEKLKQKGYLRVG